MTTQTYFESTLQEPDVELHLDRQIANRLGQCYASQIVRTGIALAVVDAIVIVIVLLTGRMAASQALASAVVSQEWMAAIATGSLLSFLLFGLYPAIGLEPAVELKRYVSALCVVFGAFVLTSICLERMSLVVAATACAVAIIGMTVLPAARFIARRQLARTSWWGIRCVVFGGQAIREAANQNPVHIARQGYRIVGCLGSGDFRYANSESGPFKDLGPFNEVHDICLSHDIGTLITSDCFQTPISEEQMNSLCLQMPRVERLEHQGSVAAGDCVGLASSSHIENGLLLPGHVTMKRLFDLLVILACSPILISVFFVITVVIKVSSIGPVYYRHQRVGKNGKVFDAWKFRTMVPNANRVLEEHLEKNPDLKREWERDHKLKNDPRITTFGWFLRKISLDELPQLLNVLKGEMSLVGPRPIVRAEVGRYGDTYELYCSVLPGITGLWQVSGRNDTSYSKRIELDRFYVSKWSMWLDLYILLRTLKTATLCEGAY